jgi:hypothetical protein
MRSLVFASAIGSVFAFAAALAAPPVVTVKAVECVYVSQNVVHAAKESGRYESGRFRCQAPVTVSADVEVPLALELQQEGKSIAKVTGKAPLGRADKSVKVELETPVPPMLEGCTKFDIVMTIATTSRTIHVPVACADPR